MSLVFSTRRRDNPPQPDVTATRLAEPRGVADVLGHDGVKAVIEAARADKIKRDVQAALQATHGTPDKAFARAEAARLDTGLIDPAKDPPDPRLIEHLGAQACLKRRVLPWRRISGRVTVLATSLDAFLRVRDALVTLFGPVHLAIVTADAMDKALSLHCHKALIEYAELRTDPAESCRDWDTKLAFRWGALIVITIATSLYMWPQVAFMVLCGWAVFTLILTTILKAVSAVLHLLPKDTGPVPANPEPAILPVVTLLVPLFRERDIAGTLVQRLSKIDYPADRLDVCLVLEADDATTQSALEQTELPPWMRAIKVPLGTLQTKPRALNYALSFAKGTIVGVYDAEDAPDPDQLRIVVRRFAQRGRNVACLQGRLDYYNAHSNWLARCFTIEYATWFRIILPGLERLGLAIPLGGTTLFFRRDVLEELGGWDAHNVTEDADLGIRLARHGFRTEIIDSTTQEEANARVLPWIKQRSRWLKGYAITYGVHMRNPVQLWKDLGPWQFFGVQLLFGATLSQFLLAPLLWSFWLMLIGIPHPLDGVLSQGAAIAFALIFLLSEVIGVTVAAIAVTSAGKREMIKWAPTLHFYFPLAAVAAYKGVIELATKPFYWDKTAHGVFAPTTPVQRDSTPPRRPRHPVAGE